MSIYEANLNFFKSNAPQLYEILESELPLCKVEIEESELNNCILEANGISCFMHSAYNVENEMQHMFNDVENDVDTMVLFGIGNGYVLEYIVNEHKNLKRLIIVEPSLDVFKRFLKLYDCKLLFGNDWRNEINITFIVNRDESFAAELIRQEIIKSKKLVNIIHVYFYNIYLDYYNNLNTTLVKQLKVTLGSLATVSTNWQMWLINSIRNLKQKSIIPIEYIQDIFKNKTVVIVSAGPSLNKNINTIKQLKDKAIIIAVGSAIKVLDSNGIVPHFRVAIDSHPGEKEVVSVEDTKVACLMFSNQLYTDIVSEYKGSKIRYILDSDFLGKYIYDKSGVQYIEFKNGPSVANGALDLVCNLCCKRVVFMGQDLSYTKEGLYAKGTTTAFKEEEKAWLDNQSYELVENIYGENVYAIHSFLQMKYVMEKTVKQYSQVEFLNATEGGLGIEGAYNVTAKEVLEKILINEDDFDLEYLNLRINNSDITEKYADSLDIGLQVMKLELDKVINIQKDIVDSLIKIESRNNKNLNKIENELFYIEKRRTNLLEISLYKDVIEPELRADIFSLIASYEYKGNNKDKLIESKLKILVGITNKVSENIEIMLELMNE